MYWKRIPREWTGVGEGALYTKDLPVTGYRKFIYVDDICLTKQAQRYAELECCLSSDMVRMASYCRLWRLKPSPMKTVTSVLHLLNTSAARELRVHMEGQQLRHDPNWLPVKQRVEYKLCMVVHRCLYSDAPSYLADLITPSAAVTVRPGLRSAASNTVQLQCHELHRRSETGPLRRLAHVHGTNFHHLFVAFILLLLSNVN